jgi:nucleotide-binding universal stress UspA family protein
MKVLIAADGTPAAAQALDTACALLAGSTAEITLLYVIPQHRAMGAGGPVSIECYDLDTAEAEAHALIDGFIARLRAGGINSLLQTEIVMGDPAECILTVADQQSSDLIILGSRGRGTFKGALLGSVSARVVTHAHCGVLVAHRKSEEAAKTGDRSQENECVASSP